MPSEDAQILFLLDEHYPGWLADALVADGIDVVALTAHRPGLRGADDARVLRAAVAEGRIVVTEDVSTFSAAASLVPDHVGIVYCHHSRFPRTRPGLEKLRKPLSALASDPPAGLGKHPIVWWLPCRIEMIQGGGGGGEITDAERLSSRAVKSRRAAPDDSLSSRSITISRSLSSMPLASTTVTEHG